MNGVAPLTVVAEAVNVRFVAASAEDGESSDARDAGAWGFRLIASGREVRMRSGAAHGYLSIFFRKTLARFNHREFRC